MKLHQCTRCNSLLANSRKLTQHYFRHHPTDQVLSLDTAQASRLVEFQQPRVILQRCEKQAAIPNASYHEVEPRNSTDLLPEHCDIAAQKRSTGASANFAKNGLPKVQIKLYRITNEDIKKFKRKPGPSIICSSAYEKRKAQKLTQNSDKDPDIVNTAGIKGSKKSNQKAAFDKNYFPLESPSVDTELATTDSDSNDEDISLDKSSSKFNKKKDLTKLPENVTCKRGACYNETIYKCGICGSQSMGRPQIASHMETVHPQGAHGIACFLCKVEFIDIRYLYRHYDRHVKADKVEREKYTLEKSWPRDLKHVSCKWCLEKIPNQPTLLSHTNSEHSEKKTIVCSFCEKQSVESQFPNWPTIFHHVKTVHKFEVLEAHAQNSEVNSNSITKSKDDHPFNCSICPFTSRNNQFSLHCHMQGVHKNGQHGVPCPVCRNEFSSVKQFSKHKLFHVKAEKNDGVDEGDNDVSTKGPKKLKCKICLLPVHSKSDYHSHMELAHEKVIRTQKIFCALCPSDSQGFESILQIFQEHLMSAHPELRSRFSTPTPKKPPVEYHCDLKGCGKKLKNRTSLAVHMAHHKRLESQTKPFKCPQCYLAYSRADSLRTHFVIHLKQNPHVCKIENCGKKFQTAYALKRHMDLHNCTIKDLLECPKCHYHYTRKRYFDRHLRVCNGRARATRHRRVRVRRLNLPFLPTVEQHEPGTSSKADTTGTGEPSSPVECLPKSEVVECGDGTRRIELEAIHLNDVILKTEGGDIHVKGEQLTPVAERSNDYSMDQSNLGTIEVPGKVPKTASTKKGKAGKGYFIAMYDNDPTFKRLAAKHPRKAALVKPTRRIVESPRYECSECKAKFKRSYYFKHHLSVYHGKSLDSVINSIDHHGADDKDSTEISFICSFCGYPAKTHEDLKQHTETADDHV